MEHISNVQITDDVTECDVDVSDDAWINLLRRSMYAIETIAIGYVVIDENSSPRSDSILAHRLGLCAIDNTKVSLEQIGELRVVGPASVTTDDIVGLPFAARVPLVELASGESLTLRCILKKGTGNDHAKWNPIAAFRIKEIESGYHVSYDTVGILPGDEIIRRAIDKMEEVAEIPSTNRFFNPLIPARI